jgi:hypothetical protein
MLVSSYQRSYQPYTVYGSMGPKSIVKVTTPDLDTEYGHQYCIRPNSRYPQLKYMAATQGGTTNLGDLRRGLEGTKVLDRELFPGLVGNLPKIQIN